MLKSLVCDSKTARIVQVCEFLPLPLPSFCFERVSEALSSLKRCIEAPRCKTVPALGMCSYERRALKWLCKWYTHTATALSHAAWLESLLVGRKSAPNCSGHYWLIRLTAVFRVSIICWVSVSTARFPNFKLLVFIRLKTQNLTSWWKWSGTFEGLNWNGLVIYSNSNAVLLVKQGVIQFNFPLNLSVH